MIPVWLAVTLASVWPVLLVLYWSLFVAPSFRRPGMFANWGPGEMIRFIQALFVGTIALWLVPHVINLIWSSWTGFLLGLAAAAMVYLVLLVIDRWLASRESERAHLHWFKNLPPVQEKEQS